jgi:hypothetical protein
VRAMDRSPCKKNDRRQVLFYSATNWPAISRETIPFVADVYFSGINVIKMRAI